MPKSLAELICSTYPNKEESGGIEYLLLMTVGQIPYWFYKNLQPYHCQWTRLVAAGNNVAY